MNRDNPLRTYARAMLKREVLPRTEGEEPVALPCHISLGVGGETRVYSGNRVIASFNMEALKRESQDHFLIVEALLWELETQAQVAAYAVAIANLAAGTPGARARNKIKRNAYPKIIADYNRFKKALRSYERIDLAGLFTEFKIDARRLQAFKLPNVAAALAIHYDLTATQIRAILRDAKAR